MCPHLVEELHGLLPGQQAQAGRGLEDQRRVAPGGGRDAGLGHLEQLQQPCGALGRRQWAARGQRRHHNMVLDFVYIF